MRTNGRAPVLAPAPRPSPRAAPTPASGPQKATYNGVLQPTTRRLDGGRRVVIDAACEACRARKSRCNGGRPTCNRCATNKIQCKYDIAPGESRLGSLKQRHAFLVDKHQNVLNLLELLRSAPMDKVDALIQGIRSGDRHVLQTLTASIQESLNSSRQQHVYPTPPSTAPLPELSGSTSLSAQLESSASGSEVAPAEQTMTSLHFVLPSKNIFQAALIAYNNSVGTLFYVYTAEQVGELFHDVFESRSASNDESLCQLCALAALGSFYSQDTISTDVAETFYYVSKHFLDNLIERHPFLAIKVLAVLGMVNIITKSTVTLAFFDLALSMSETFKYQDRTPPPGVPHSQWVECRRLWRTLVLCASWISSSLGVVSTANWRCSYTSLQQMNADYGFQTDISDVIQVQMAQVAILKANVLQSIDAADFLLSDAITAIRADLMNWHDQLPQVMRLQNTLEAGIAASHRHKVYLVHLLYLGALMLFQRCIMSRLLRSHVNTSTQTSISPEITECINDGYMAARQSARILGLLKQGKGVVERCWICIFQSYMSGLLTVHESYQKLLQGTETQDDLDESLNLISLDVGVLAICATNDAVAGNLLQTLQTHHDFLKSIEITGIECYINSNNMAPLKASPFAFATPSSIEGSDSELHKMTNLLLQVISHPLGGMSEPSTGSGDMYADWRKQKTLDETAFGVYLDWRWDAIRRPGMNESRSPSTSISTSNTSPGSDDVFTGQHSQYLDSNQSSGWSSESFKNIRRHETSSPAF